MYTKVTTKSRARWEPASALVQSAGSDSAVHLDWARDSSACSPAARPSPDLARDYRSDRIAYKKCRKQPVPEFGESQGLDRAEGLSCFRDSASLHRALAGDQQAWAVASDPHDRGVAIAQAGDGLSADTKGIVSALLRRTIACSPKRHFARGPGTAAATCRQPCQARRPAPFRSLGRALGGRVPMRLGENHLATSRRSTGV